MVSIIIPNYNRARYLQQTLESILKQKYDQWEALVVDDGSTDSSKDLVSSFAERENRIKWIQREGKFRGAPACRNLGIKHSRGEFIIFLDSDDLLAPHCLQQRIEVMEHQPNLDFAVFPMLLFHKIREDGNVLWNIETEESDLQRFLKLDAVWQTSGPIWKKVALQRLGCFDESLICWQDVDIHLRALINDFSYEKKYDLSPDAYYRKGSVNSISQQEINSPLKLESRFRILKKIYYLGGNSRNISLRPICINILISAIRAKNLKFFIEVFTWSIQRSVLSFRDYFEVIKIAQMSFGRFDKIPFGKRYLELTIERIVEINTIGKIKYETIN